MICQVIALVIFVYTIWLAQRRRASTSEPPVVPYWIPWLGSGYQYGRDPIGFLRECENKYGSIFTLLLGGKFITFVVDPFTHAAVAKKNNKFNFWSHTADIVDTVFDYKFDKTYLERHSHIFRSLLIKKFQGKGLQNSINIFTSNMQKILSNKQFANRNWQEIGLLDFCYDILFVAGYHTLFSTEDNVPTNAEMKSIVKNFRKFDDAFPLLVQGYPKFIVKNFCNVRKKCWKALSLGNCLKYVDNFFSDYQKIFGSALEKRNILKQSLALLWASESNTCLSAFWLLYYILKHPNAKEMVLQEIHALCDVDRASNFQFTKKNLIQMPILDSIMKEAFRITLSPSSIRQVVEDCEICVTCEQKSYSLRKGDKVMALYQLTHTDPDIYKNPFAFHYDRFIPDDISLQATKQFYKNGNAVKHNLQPFGMGASACPGQLWATVALKRLVILTLLQLDMELLSPEEDIKQQTNRVGLGTLSPNRDPILKFKLNVS